MRRLGRVIYDVMPFCWIVNILQNYGTIEKNVLSQLKKNKEKKCAKVIWLDSTASTGSTHFQVMPYVDKYWKNRC